MFDFSSWIKGLGSMLACVGGGIQAVFEWISSNANAITAFFTFFLMLIALVGLSTWREQLEGTTKHKLATDILESILIYRNALKRVRAWDINKSEMLDIDKMYEQNTAGRPNEFEQLLDKYFAKLHEIHQEKELTHQEALRKELEQIRHEQKRERLQYQADTIPQAYQLRLQRAADARRQVESLLVKGEVSIGDEIMGLADNLIDLEGQLWQALRVFRQELFIAANPSPFEDFDEEQLQIMGRDEVDARAWRFDKKLGEGSDEFDMQLQKEIDLIKDKLRSYTRPST